MRKFVLMLAGVSILILSSARLNLAQREPSEGQLLKSRQKQERATFKLREQNQKQSFRGQAVPDSVRTESKHELQRDKRALHEKQRNERQELRDRQKMARENARHL